MSYFLLRSDEDGTTIEEIPKDELLERITPNEYNETYYGYDLNFLSHIPANDKGYWVGAKHNDVIIIKGEIIVPKPKNYITKYILEDKL